VTTDPRKSTSSPLDRSRRTDPQITPQSRAIVCCLFRPRFPGHSGGEIRDFHLIRQLLAICSIELFALFDVPAHDQTDLLCSKLSAAYDPSDLKAQANPRLGATPPKFQGVRYHSEAVAMMTHASREVLWALDTRLRESPPDYLFVTSQINPAGLLLERCHESTRWIFASYDVESVRVGRLARGRGPRGWLRRVLEQRRAARYESDSLAKFDGVIAVSELDRERFIEKYRLDPRRVAALPNGVDTEHFDFRARMPGGNPQIVYTGSFTYEPNREAAWRLIREIMPRVRRHHPGACLWIVGQEPGKELLNASDGRSTVVTGLVADVRPYLARASAVCVPLSAGSGTKLKMLEAMSAGAPVVATSIAIEGLDVADGEHLLVRDSNEQIAQAIHQMIDDPQRARSIARAARRQMETHYSWDRTLAGLDSWLTSITTMPAAGRQ